MIGGGFRSEYLHKRVKRYLRHRNINSYNAQTKNAVTRGGFGQYPDLHEDKLPESGTWVLKQPEEWNHKLHPDMTTWPLAFAIVDKLSGKVLRKLEPGENVDLKGHEEKVWGKVGQPIAGKFRLDQWNDNVVMVDDRVLPLLVRTLGKTSTRTRALLDVYVDANNSGRLTLPIYFSQGARRISAHSALMKDGRVKPYFEEWPVQYSDLPNPEFFEKHGFELQEKDGSEFFVVPGVVEIEGDEDEEDLRVKLRLLAYDQRSYSMS